MVNVLTEPARRPRIIPDSFILLANWRYIEHAILKVVTGWGRSAEDWEDKLAVCYHVWLAAQTVDALRKRLDMFPGGKPDAPVHAAFESLANTVLLAPSWKDAMHGLHGVLIPALAAAYMAYLSESHPVHDRPTHELLRDALERNRTQADWFASFRRRFPHTIDARYESAIRARLAEAGHLSTALPPVGVPARPCGASVDFRMPVTPGRVKDWNAAPNIMPHLQVNWSTSVEARRLFFIIGYLWEMGVAENQLRWLYHSDFMPWEFVYEEARHMWDESRHGDSGLARLRDFGLGIADVGYSSYGAFGGGTLAPMTPRDVYEAFYRVTQISETGYFETKRYCFEDFLAGGDQRSADMMRFDIIDETSHVEYGRKWLEEMQRRAGVTEDYRKRGAAERAAAQALSDKRTEALRHYAQHGRLPDAVDLTNDGFLGDYRSLRDPAAEAHYTELIDRLRATCPLSNASTAPIRPNLPM